MSARLRASLLLGLLGCDGFVDPEATGLRISPGPGDYLGPVDLIITNTTGVDLECEINEDAGCAAVFDAPLLTLPAGERWRADEVLCVNVDIACLPAGSTSVDLPVRAWAWFVRPPVEE